MAKGKGVKGIWADLATTGARLAVRVAPNARTNGVTRDGAALDITTTATPEGGKATAMVRDLLAHALGLAPSRLTLISGATSRDKVFAIT